MRLTHAYILGVLLSLMLLFSGPLGVGAQAHGTVGSNSKWTYVMPIDVKKAFELGKQNMMSHLYGSSLELSLPGCSGVFSKKQAEMIMTDFLSSHSKMVYTVDYEESVGGSTVTIGKLVRSGEMFRVYVTTRRADGVLQIKQFRIEEQK